MALEDLTGTDKFITALVPNNPDGLDDRRQGDDHDRGIKNVLLNSFPNIDAPVTATPAQLNQAVNIAGKVAKAGDTMTGPLTVEEIVRAVQFIATPAP
jgi:hypothetical protein